MTQITNEMYTEWFPGAVKPVRKGVYRVEKSFGEMWAHWDGRTWSHGSCEKVLTEPVFFRLKRFHTSSAFPVLRWCGLQGDAHSLQIAANTYLVDFGDEKN